MISIDTNIIIRLLTGDDPAQFKKAKALFENETIFITISVVLESEWVLRYAFQLKPLDIIDAFLALFGLPNVKLEDEAVIFDAIEWHKLGLDFADAIHLAKSHNAQAFATFDKRLVKTAARITNRRLIEP